MNKLNIRLLAAIVFLSLHCYAQHNRLEIEDTKVDSPVLLNSDKRSLNTENLIEAEKNEITLFKYSVDFLHLQKTIKEDLRSSIVKSFRSNIRFGGFWDKYTIVNITPETNLQLLDFISIYAVHNMSFFVPMDRIKENIRSMVLRSAAVLLVDNSVNLFWGSSRIVSPLVNFLLKNILVFVINKAEKKADSRNNLLNYDYQYYSVSIRF